MTIESLEKEFIDKVKLEDYLKIIKGNLPDLTYTYQSIRDLDSWVKSFFAGVENELEALLVRTYVIGIYIAQNKNLPKAAFSQSIEPKKYIETDMQKEGIKYIQVKGGVDIKGATESTIQKTREIIADGMSKHLGWREIGKRLAKEIDEDGILKRDWDRVSISLINESINNGFIATKDIGDYVIGVGFKDACELCKKYIIGKVFKIGEAPVSQFENLDPLSRQYRELVDYYEKYLWVGKNNFSRSGSETKNAEGGRVPRLRHEIYFAAPQLHPHCRCRLLPVFPEEAYADKNGNFIMRLDSNEEQWQQWYNKNIKERFSSAA